MFKFRFAAYFNFISVYHLPATAARKETLYKEILSKTEIWRHITFHKSVNHLLSKDSLENGHWPKLVGKTDNPHMYIYIYIYLYIYLYIHIYKIYIYIYIWKWNNFGQNIGTFSFTSNIFNIVSIIYLKNNIFQNIFITYFLLI